MRQTFPINTVISLVRASLVAALLAACASTGGALSDQPVAAYRDSIALSGRLSVQYVKNGAPESVTGAPFVWTQTPQRLDVSLSSPLGQTIATISVTPQEATLIEAGHAPRVAPDIDALSAQSLGWALPVSGLREWLQGYATSNEGQRFIATPRNNTVTTRDGWRLRYVSWQEGAANPAPKRIDAERDATATTDALSIRIVLDAQG